MLFLHGNLDRVRANFANQFRDEERGLVFRQGGRGLAIPVTAQERDAFVATFNRSIARFGWAVVLSGAMAAGMLEAFPDALPPALRAWQREGATAVLVAIFVAFWWRIQNAPARALDRRAAIGNPLTPQAARRDRLARLPWSIVAAGLLLPFVLFVRVSFDADPWRSDLGPILVALVALPVVAAVAFAKAHAGRSARGAGDRR